MIDLGIYNPFLQIKQKAFHDVRFLGLIGTQGLIFSANNRMDYTVIGDCVNVAARLQGLAAGGEIIIGEQTDQHIQGLFAVEKRGKDHKLH